MNAEVTKTGALDMQVCVPEDWTGEQVVEFANNENRTALSVTCIYRLCFF
uniref:Uncharacterized protein n=1 Tax=viral metagenome TaxID=1070528 RepID=A0A6H1ZZV0_9ZZZZ